MSEKVYGGVEAGGTKFVCVIGTGPDILEKTVFPTTNPDETIQKAISFFLGCTRLNPLAAVGIASFGPSDIHKNSATWGYITSTPKDGWSNVDFAQRVHRQLNVPVAFDTDTNGAALGEYVYGAARGLDTFIYLTVGTGIGGGGVVNGKPMHGLVHPEMGHIRIPHGWQEDPFPGNCPYHGDCLEGLASGKAMELRWGQSPDKLPLNHPAWELEAKYLALAINNYICAISPERIIVGGGVMKNPHLITAIRSRVEQNLNKYVRSDAIIKDMEQYIVPPGLGDLAGVIGAIELAKRIESI